MYLIFFFKKIKDRKLEIERLYIKYLKAINYKNLEVRIRIKRINWQINLYIYPNFKEEYGFMDKF